MAIDVQFLYKNLVAPNKTYESVVDFFESTYTGTTDEEDLKAHIELVHRKSITFECGHCGKKLSNMNSKERHERKFPNALCIKMPFECELCPYRNQFKLRDSLYRHIKNFHKGINTAILRENINEQKPFSCVKCKRNFTSMDLH